MSYNHKHFGAPVPFLDTAVNLPGATRDDIHLLLYASAYKVYPDTNIGVVDLRAFPLSPPPLKWGDIVDPCDPPIRWGLKAAFSPGHIDDPYPGTQLIVECHPCNIRKVKLPDGRVALTFTPTLDRPVDALVLGYGRAGAEVTRRAVERLDHELGRVIEKAEVAEIPHADAA